MDLRTLIEEGLAVIRARRPVEAELGAPLTDAELDGVQRELGFALDPSFVDLFRSVNGFRIVGAGVNVHVRPLGELFGPPGPFFPPGGDDRTPYLGGISSGALSRGLRVLGRPTDLDPYGYDVIALYADGTRPDPVAVWVTDHGADATGRRPVRAVDLIWMLGMHLDLREVLSYGWFEAQGASGDHPRVTLGLEARELGSCVPGAPDEDWQSQQLVHLKGEVGLRGCARTPAPVRWSSASSSGGGHAVEVLTQRFQAAFPTRMESWHDQVELTVEGSRIGLVIRTPPPPKRKKKLDPHAKLPDAPPAGALAHALGLRWSSADPAELVARARAVFEDLIR